jgi:hypothetical protein
MEGCVVHDYGNWGVVIGEDASESDREDEFYKALSEALEAVYQEGLKVRKGLRRWR